MRVEALCGTHAAGHSQHLPKGASGLWNKGLVQAQTAHADPARTKPLCLRDVMDGCDSGESLLPPTP